MAEDLDKLESAPAEVRARAYDLVLNGNEIAGGSIRIHRGDIQSRVFKAIGLTKRTRAPSSASCWTPSATDRRRTVESRRTRPAGHASVWRRFAA